MSTPTFAESFCAQHRIAPEQFVQAVFKKALYRRARVFAPALRFFNHDYFAADFDLIYGVEHLRRVRDFTAEAERFNEHPGNRGWLRRRLCLRVSTKRLKALMRETLAHSTVRPAVTASPFESADSDEESRLSLVGS
ncbi:MAG: hypothetical protein JF599_04175 [Verrucomicrobia bacterium]|nr:hypothetical protein [Verrucomicrobiota bacterium]